jgi:aryl-alcohol dehydrogenase-like predicted oxidoreductase
MGSYDSNRRSYEIFRRPAPAWVISNSNAIAEAPGWSSFIGMQIMYNLIERSAELDIGVTAWSPLGGGVLSGKYNIDNTDEEKRYSVANPMSSSFINEKNRFIATELRKIAREIDKTPSQVALNWIMQNEQY